MNWQTDHISAGLARLVEQFKGKPNLRAFLGAYLGGAQSIEDALWQLFTDRWVGNALGASLDVIGRIVGQARDNSADDDEYRIRIKARIRANLSSGSVENIYSVFRTLLPASALSIAPAYPAGFTLTVSEVLTDAYAALYATFLAAAKSAGVGAQLIWQPAENAEAFTFDSESTFLATYFDSDPDISIEVVSTAGFPASGSFVIDAGTDYEETLAYSSLDATHLIGVTSLTEHYAGAVITPALASATGLGFGDTTDASTGGALVGIIGV